MNDATPQPAEWTRVAWPLVLAVEIVWCSSRVVWEPSVVPSNDKLVHALVFGLLATLMARIAAVQRTRGLGIYTAVLIVSAFGASDEIHQYFTPGRDSEVLDWVADTAGAALATVLYARWHWYRALLETPVVTLLKKRRVEIARAACLIGRNGISGSEQADRGAARAGRAP
ncbi:MAG TPA: VanZ family protein [Opitutus sp.]|nr:VanZ family protein [Opitutus sp.]